MIKELQNNPDVPSFLKLQYRKQLLSDQEFIREAEKSLAWLDEHSGIRRLRQIEKEAMFLDNLQAEAQQRVPQ